MTIYSIIKDTGVIRHYPVQGELFEKVVECLFCDIFVDWDVKRVGWSPDQPDGNFKVIEDVAKSLDVQDMHNHIEQLQQYKRMADWI